MALIWNLRKWLAVERDIYKPSQLQALIREKTGVELSLQALSALMTEQPSALRIQTIQTLCDALECDLHAFCNVTPTQNTGRHSRQKAVGETRRLYGGKNSTPIKEATPSEGGSPTTSFPRPHQFFSAEQDESGHGSKS